MSNSSFRKHFSQSDLKQPVALELGTLLDLLDSATLPTDVPPTQVSVIPPIVGDREARMLLYVYVEEDKDKGLDVSLDLALVRKPNEWLVVAKTYEGGTWGRPLDKDMWSLGSDLSSAVTVKGQIGNNGMLALSVNGSKSRAIQLPSEGFRGLAKANVQGSLPEHPAFWPEASLNITVDGSLLSASALETKGVMVPPGRSEFSVTLHTGQ